MCAPGCLPGAALLSPSSAQGIVLACPRSTAHLLSTPFPQILRVIPRDGVGDGSKRTRRDGVGVTSQAGEGGHSVEATFPLTVE